MQFGSLPHVKIVRFQAKRRNSNRLFVVMNLDSGQDDEASGQAHSPGGLGDHPRVRASGGPLPGNAHRRSMEDSPGDRAEDAPLAKSSHADPRRAPHDLFNAQAEHHSLVDSPGGRSQDSEMGHSADAPEDSSHGGEGSPVRLLNVDLFWRFTSPCDSALNNVFQWRTDMLECECLGGLLSYMTAVCNIVITRAGSSPCSLSL